MVKNKPTESSLWRKCMNYLAKDDSADILHATRVTRLLHRLGGYDVYDLKRLPGNDVHKSANKFGAWAWLLWCLVTVWCMYDAIFQRNPEINEIVNSYQFKKAENVIDYLLSAVLTFHVRLNVITGHGELCELYESLLWIDDGLRRLGVRINYKDIKNKQYLIPLYQAIALLLIMSSHILRNTPFKILFTSTIKFHVMATSLTMFYYSVSILTTRHRYLNDVLRGVLNSGHYEGVRVLGGGAGPRLISQKSTSSDTINAVGEIFDKIYSAKIVANKLFGTTLVLLIVYCFVTTILYSSYLIEFIAKEISGDKSTAITIFIATLFFYTAFRMFVIYSIGDICDQIYSESTCTGWIVDDIINEQSEEETIESARRLSLQLWHQQHKFTANGFFVLDRSVIVSVLATTSTYLVVLLQFSAAAKP